MVKRGQLVRIAASGDLPLSVPFSPLSTVNDSPVSRRERIGISVRIMVARFVQALKILFDEQLQAGL